MRAALLAGLVLAALGGASPALAEPISLAILGASAAGTFAASALTFVIGAVATTALSLGLSALSKATAQKSKAGEPLSGVETSVQIGGDIARQICIGLTGVRGQLVFHNTSGANNQYHQQVYVLSDWLSVGINAIIIEGKRHAVTADPQGGGLTLYSV